MTTSTSNRHTSNTEEFLEAGHSHATAASAALYYPSMIGNCWDDELLPSGD